MKECDRCKRILKDSEANVNGDSTLCNDCNDYLNEEDSMHHEYLLCEARDNQREYEQSEQYKRDQYQG